MMRCKHRRVVCSCGVVLAECHCSHMKLVVIDVAGCAACRGTQQIRAVRAKEPR